MHQSFTQLLDRGISSPIVEAQWCPTMDLLAFVTKEGQLQLHRLNWQRLWSITPEEPITCLCWRPDGKQLALGHTDGFVSIRSAEDGEELVRSQIFLCSVSNISWHHSSPESSHYPPNLAAPFHDRSRRLFDRPSSTLSVLSMIVGIDVTGRIAMCGAEKLHLLAYSNQLCSYHAQQQQTEHPRAIAISRTLHANHICMDQYQREMAICWSSTSTSTSTGSAENEYDDASRDVLHLTTFDISVIGEHVPMLRMLSLLTGDILQGIESCNQACQRVWDEYAIARGQKEEMVAVLVGSTSNMCMECCSSKKKAFSRFFLFPLDTTIQHPMVCLFSHYCCIHTMHCRMIY